MGRQAPLLCSLASCFVLLTLVAGCRWLQFVDEAWFDGVVALVIVSNLLLIVMEPLGGRS